ncbi:MAG TPA: shikimate dehydrogenase [Xanthobacteraceae bacterium]|nr:shikimate dehydrogenase [Xanthobacteraceae bacterium]
MTASLRRACIMGHPVAQSRSPMLHGYWLRTLGVAGTYDRADVAPQDFPAFFRDLPGHGFVGGNITKPHKEAAFRLVDRREGAADTIGAVNTVWFEDGTLVGGNTDYLGFLAHADDRAPGWDAPGGLALVLGAGGAARAIVYGLRERGLDVALVNRTRARAEELARDFAPRVRVHGIDELPRLLADAVLLTNATALGALGQPPLTIDLGPLRAGAVVYDINYVPLETDLIKAAARRGLRTVDGLGMLLHQAVPAFAKWFGIVPKVTAELRALLEADIRAKTGAG